MKEYTNENDPKLSMMISYRELIKSIRKILYKNDSINEDDWGSLFDSYIYLDIFYRCLLLMYENDEIIPSIFIFDNGSVQIKHKEGEINKEICKIYRKFIELIKLTAIG